MPATVMIYQITGHTRSRIVCEAMARGIAAYGDSVTIKDETSYSGIEADIAVFYGLVGNTPKIFEDYSLKASAVYTDLGYWARREGGRFSGYHKLVINDRHPTNYFQSVKHDSARTHNVSLAPWKKSHSSSHILLAGMGDKGAEAEGYQVEQWEREVIKELRKVTSRPIVYRPKPSWKFAQKIEGVGYSSPRDSLEEALINCHAVVSHHSNVCIDGLIAGIPSFTTKGAALPMSLTDLTKIEEPYYPLDREQWINDLSYCQWSVKEMKSGDAWAHIKKEHLQ